MGKIEVFETEIKQLGRQREVYVYLPDGYREDGEPYPVIYMQDGQNLFAAKNKIDGPTWEADLTMQRLEKETGRAAILVGVAYGQRRMTEYGPWRTTHPKVFRDPGSVGGEGMAYAQFFADDLVTEIERRYNVIRDRTARAVCGSSMGSYISCYIGIANQEKFSAMGLFSTAVWVNASGLYRFIDQTPQSFTQYALVYVGGSEGVSGLMTDRTYLLGSFRLYQQLEKKGVRTEFLVASGKKHYENVWAVYFEQFARNFLKNVYKSEKE